MTGLSLSLLGSFQASLDAKPLTDFRTRKVQALLIYLAVEPGAHSREWLLNLFWPGLPEISARSNLRQILYYLRQVVPKLAGDDRPDEPLVIANRQEIQLNPQVGVTVDTHQFTVLLQQSQMHQHLDLFLCRECAHDLEEAVALYRGDFLADFYLDDSNEYEEWSHAQREHFRRQALDALSTLATMSLRRQEYAAAQAHAERQLEFDNLREGAYRQLMEILAHTGRREQALAVYDKCRRVLTEELGMAPSTQTTAVYEKIRAGDLRFEQTARPGVRGYELKEEIAEGAYGTVYRAVQPTIQREVAVKVIRRKHASDPDFIRRFEGEAQIVARLEHPYIVPLYDYWRDPEGAYLAMRYMRGGSLLTELKAGPWDAARTAGLLDQIAGALAVAHRQGVVHRDIKPGNILLDEAGNAYLADFGIAKDLAREQQVTADGTLIGTLDYTSPEQITSGEVSPQSDIYSLGAVLYEVLTGEKPFSDTSVAKLLYSHINEPIPLVAATRPDVPPEIDTVLQTATAKEPAQRYATVLEMAAAFRQAAAAGHAEGEGREWEVLPALVEVTNPYKGLHAFQEADAEDFFGREALVQQLVARLGAARSAANGQSGRFLAVVGPSGSGKSSVVKAGLIPALREGALPDSDKWFITEMIPGSNPLHELELALWRVAVDPPPDLVTPMRRDTDGILRTIRRILPLERSGRATIPASDPQLLLVIDQFEELFTLVEDEGERLFFLESLLAALSAPRSPLRLVVTLRADFYDRPLQYPAWGQLFKAHTEIVLPLNKTELTWAIREPARRMGVRLEEGLADTIIADVADQPGALPLLQYAMTELFEQQEGRLITRAAYEALGGVQGALGKRAEAVFDELDEAGRQTARQLFLRLVTLGEGTEDTRRRVLRSELESLAGSEPDADDSLPSAVGVLDRFGSARFLTFDRDPLTRVPTVEVAHEALLREWLRLRSWLAESRDDIRLQRLLAQATGEWQTAGRDPGYLLRGARLDQFAGWEQATSVALSAVERDFINASVAAREERLTLEEERRQRELQAARELAETQQRRAEEQASAAQRLRRRAAYLAGALVIAAVLAVLAATFARSATHSADLAATREAEALANAGLAATREVEALANADLAADLQAEAEAEADLRATAEAIAVQEREAAEEQTRLALSRGLAANAIVNMDDDPELSMLLALYALEQSDTLEAQEALHEAMHTSRLLQRLPNERDEAFYYHVLYSPDGTRLAVSQWNGNKDDIETQVRDAETLEVLFTIPGDFTDDRWVDADRMMIIGPHSDPNLTEFRQADAAGRILSTTDIPIPWIDLGWNDYSDDGTLIAVSTVSHGQISIFDLATGALLQTLGEIGDPPPIATFRFSPDGSLLATTNLEEMILWDVASGEALLTRSGFGASAVAFSRDGTQLAYTTSLANGMFILDIASGQDLLEFFGHTGQTGSLEFNADGSHLISSALDGTVRIWDTVTGQTLLKVKADGLGGPKAILSPDGSRLAAVTQGGLFVWGVTPEYGREWLTVPSGADARGFAFSPDGSLLAVPQADTTVRLLDAVSGRPVITFTSPTSPTEEIIFPVFSPDGTQLAGVISDTLALWDVQTGQGTLLDTGHDSLVRELAYSPDGTRLATISLDQTARLWDMPSGEMLFTMDVSTEPLNLGSRSDLSFSPDGRLLATVGGSSIKVWDTATAEELLTISTGDTGGYTAAFSPDGSRLAIGLSLGFGGGVWDVATGEELFHLSGHTGSITKIAFSPDGQQIATSSVDGTARLWDASTGATQLILKNHTGQVAFVAYSPDGTRLATQDTDGVVRLWAVRVDDLVELARARLTRWFTPAECLQYLHLEECPDEP